MGREERGGDELLGREGWKGDGVDERGGRWLSKSLCI